MQEDLGYDIEPEEDIQEGDPTAFEIDFSTQELLAQLEEDHRLVEEWNGHPDPLDPTVERMRGVARHGYTPFDMPIITELAHNLWQGGCENGLILPKFIKHVVSLYPWERYTTRHTPDSYLEVVMYDSEDQGYDQVEELADWINKRRATGPVLVHCQAGLNRSSLVATLALMRGDNLTADEAITQVRARRSPACLCNPAFETWLRSQDAPATS